MYRYDCGCALRFEDGLGYLQPCQHHHDKRRLTLPVRIVADVCDGCAVALGEAHTPDCGANEFETVYGEKEHA